MSPSQTMTPEMLAGVLRHLFQEGMTAFQRKDMAQAGQWFAQCLSVLRQLGGNEEFISQVLFYTGYVLAYTQQRPSAIACLSASANIQKRMGNSEAEADCFYTTGSVISDLAGYQPAERYLTEALRRYQALGLTDKIKATEQELARLATQARGKTPEPTDPSAMALEFGLYVDKELDEKLTIAEDGEVTWHTLPALKKPAALGLVNQWQVVCLNYSA